MGVDPGLTRCGLSVIEGGRGRQVRPASTSVSIFCEMNRMAVPHPKKLIRPLVHKLHAYVPGEQPKIKGLIKLNTNENPYPPAPQVLRTVRAAVDGRLRLYPNPAAENLRRQLARLHRCRPEHIIVGNGSDEVLALAVPRYYGSVKRAEEATLRQNLSLLRDAVDKHYADTGRYPATLDDLVARRYLRSVPVDPVTGSNATWTVVAPPSAGR